MEKKRLSITTTLSHKWDEMPGLILGQAQFGIWSGLIDGKFTSTGRRICLKTHQTMRSVNYRWSENINV